MSPVTISACVIARDEEPRLPACLESLTFCDEVILVDSGSRDRTREIAREAGATVIENPWPGFAAQRNVALDAASGDWVIEVDADERVSPELAAEIRAFAESAPASIRMAAIPIRELFLGRPLGPSARYPGYRHRLFRAGAFRHDEERTVHEGLWPVGPTPALRGELDHLLASSWAEAMRDAVAYARLEATQHSRPAVGEALVSVAVRPAAKLAYRLLLYGGWRDGWRGWAKLSLECATDSLAAALRIPLGHPGGTSGFGQETPRQGPVRLIGVSRRRRTPKSLISWLEAAAEAGADVALVATGPPAGTTLPCRLLDGSGPGALARGLDAEDQARPIDALVLAGRREHRLLRLVPRALRGRVDPLSPTSPAVEVVRSVQRRTRDEATT